MAEWNIIFPMDYFYTTWWSPLVESCRACGRRWAEVGASDCLIAWCEQEGRWRINKQNAAVISLSRSGQTADEWTDGNPVEQSVQPQQFLKAQDALRHFCIAVVLQMLNCWRRQCVSPIHVPPYTVLVSCASWWHGPYNKGYDVCHYFAMHGLRFLSNNWMPATCCEARNTANPRIQGFTLSRATKANQLHQALFS